ncbi:potassium channel family protein [Nocardioides antri]|uniref:potassium channel family protein n=1 Tax=Nocardioides antri TaxID=2607659 RepID=UPI001CB70530|nr:potassium channel family protein [Nocardioides antri]
MTRVEQWERRTEVPLLLLALAFLAAYAWPVLDPGLHPTLENGLQALSWAVWGAFLVDFGVRVSLAEQRGRYVLRHWYDVALVVLPMLRPLRLLRALAVARILGRTFAHNRAGRVTVYVIGATVATIGLGALAVLDAERADPHANITTFGDALWWAVTTVTTVGYGDFYPVSTGGRLIAVVLMLVGIALLGSITATIASWLVASAAEAEEEEMEQAVDESTAAVLAALDDLRRQVAALESRLDAGDPAAPD